MSIFISCTATLIEKKKYTFYCCVKWKKFELHWNIINDSLFSKREQYNFYIFFSRTFYYR